MTHNAREPTFQGKLDIVEKVLDTSRCDDNPLTLLSRD